MVASKPIVRLAPVASLALLKTTVSPFLLTVPVQTWLTRIPSSGLLWTRMVGQTSWPVLLTTVIEAMKPVSQFDPTT